MSTANNDPTALAPPPGDRPVTEDRLREAEGLAARWREARSKATPGPWEVGDDYDPDVRPDVRSAADVMGNVVCEAPGEESMLSLVGWPGNAAFIALAGTEDVAGMLDGLAAEVRRLRAENAAHERHHALYADACRERDAARALLAELVAADEEGRSGFMLTFVEEIAGRARKLLNPEVKPDARD